MKKIKYYILRMEITLLLLTLQILSLYAGTFEEKENKLFYHQNNKSLKIASIGKGLGFLGYGVIDSNRFFVAHAEYNYAPVCSFNIYHANGKREIVLGMNCSGKIYFDYNKKNDLIVFELSNNIYLFKLHIKDYNYMFSRTFDDAKVVLESDLPIYDNPLWLDDSTLQYHTVLPDSTLKKGYKLVKHLYKIPRRILDEMNNQYFLYRKEEVVLERDSLIYNSDGDPISIVKLDDQELCKKAKYSEKCRITGYSIIDSSTFLVAIEEEKENVMTSIYLFQSNGERKKLLSLEFTDRTYFKYNKQNDLLVFMWDFNINLFRVGLKDEVLKLNRGEESILPIYKNIDLTGIPYWHDKNTISYKLFADDRFIERTLEISDEILEKLKKM